MSRRSVRVNSSDEYKVGRFAEFDRHAKRFVKKKKFLSLPDQIEGIIEQFESGNFDGDLISRSELPLPHDVYKLRLPNPDANAGKSDGYRVIYLVVTENKIVILLTIYYKKEQESVTDTYIKWLIDGYFLGALPYDEP